mmetsp:Transcript_46807/g.50500  ORF Transcript_46807/g.50500 Transcript_46807/m.50500 type:complete len:106 (-) Transcript_46807:1199-1516(-)
MGANTETFNSESGLLQHVNRLHLDGAVAARRMEEEENLVLSTKKAATGTGTDNSWNSKIEEGWDEDDVMIEEEEKVGDERKNTAGAVAGDKNEDMGAMGARRMVV